MLDIFSPLLTYISKKFQQLDKNPLAGYIYAIVAQIAFSLVGLILKFTTLHAFQSLFMRNLAVLVINYGIIFFFNGNALKVTTKSEKILCLRGILGVISQALSFHVVMKLPLSEGKVLMSTTPIWTSLICSIFLNEKFTKMQFLTMIICLFAVILIMKPNFVMKHLPNFIEVKQQVSSIWYIFALLSAFVRSCTIALVRLLKGKADETTIVHYFCIFGILLTVPFEMYSEIVYPTLWDYFLFFGIMGAVATSGSLLIAKSYFREQPSKITIISFLQVILSYIYDLYLLDIKVDWMSTLGIFIVCISIINLIIVNNNKKKK